MANPKRPRREYICKCGEKMYRPVKLVVKCSSCERMGLVLAGYNPSKKTIKSYLDYMMKETDKLRQQAIQEAITA